MRADKVRNRDAVLTAAATLFDAASDPDEVSMDAVAAAAGVGKGTVFRGFGDRRGLVLALWHERMATFDEVEPPGTAASPRDRALDLLLRTWRFKERHRVLALALERDGGGSPYGHDTYDRWHATLRDLLTEARAPGEVGFLAHALLAAVRSDFVEHLRDRSEVDPQRGLADLVDAIVR